jgi:protein-disulfide isomerase
VKQGVKTAMIAALALAAGVGGTLLATGGAASTGATINVTDRAAIESIVREYILTHPEILPEAMRNLEAREAAKQVSDNRAVIEAPFAGAWQGSANPDVTLVEFFDYSCGYCRQSRPDIERLIAEDPKLRIVYRELPILGADSVKAAQLSLAVAKLSGYATFHHTVFSTGRPTDAVVDAAIKAAGLDPATVRQGANAPDILKEIENNMRLQRALALSGTPSWVVGDKLINGAVGYNELKAAVAEARKAK